MQVNNLLAGKEVFKPFWLPSQDLLPCMIWNTKSFDDLTKTELYGLLQVRAEVFVVEQNCPYQDIDDKDMRCIHLWAEDEKRNILAYCRLLPEGISYKEPSIGRVLTSSRGRKNGIGRLLMQKAVTYIGEQWKAPVIRISAQLYLLKFYSELGFEQVGEPYPEDNIPHIEMQREG